MSRLIPIGKVQTARDAPQCRGWRTRLPSRTSEQQCSDSLRGGTLALDGKRDIHVHEEMSSAAQVPNNQAKTDGKDAEPMRGLEPRTPSLRAWLGTCSRLRLVAKSPSSPARIGLARRNEL